MTSTFGYGKTAEELRRHTGSLKQLARITAAELSDGREKGVRILDFHTGGGFNFTVVPDRCMDIAFADYRGHNLAWMSPTTITAPTYYEPQAWGWIRGFFGGLLTTCGLVNVGMPDNYRNEPIGAHGRISNTPATNLSWDTLVVGDEIHLVARGEMREVRPPHTCLVMKRTIRAVAGTAKVQIVDRVINEGYEKTPIQILYHINAGFPVVSGTSHFVAASKCCTPRDENSEESKELFRLCQGPTPGYSEKVYYHELLPREDGMCWAGLVNPDVEGGLALYVKYDPSTLPILSQWKMMGEGMYTFAMEPTNTYGIGSDRMRGLGLLKYLNPGEEMVFRVEIGALLGSFQLNDFEGQAMKNSPANPDFMSVLT